MKRLKLAGLIAAPFTPFDERGDYSVPLRKGLAVGLAPEGEFRSDGPAAVHDAPCEVPILRREELVQGAAEDADRDALP